jgi:hypothetical protein
MSLAMLTVLLTLSVLTIAGILLWLSRVTTNRRFSAGVRFGHAFPNPKESQTGDPIGDAADLLKGALVLGPRDPSDESAVWLAESILNIDRTKRPVYAYVGCLHPDMGRIGIIMGYEWFVREPHGVSRCDTGGLAGCRGGFRHLSPAEAAAAVSSLSYSPPHPGWRQFLAKEVRTSFGVWKSYLRGDEPTVTTWRDVRRRCIEAVRNTGTDLDRRLWTWEARAFAGIERHNVESIVLAPGAYKEFRDRFSTPPPPAHVHILVGTTNASGVHYFLEDQVVNAFQGVFP